MKGILIPAIWLAAALCPACTGGLTPPRDFVTVGEPDQGPYVLRAVSADGMVVALRHENNPKDGTLKFWTEAVKRELTGGRGYKLVKEDNVTSDAGVQGKMLEFSAASKGVPATYLVAIYVKSDTVVVAEAGGKADAVASRGEELRKALLSAK